jgi:N-acetylglucosamine kinase-like BadF-type ATPase
VSSRVVLAVDGGNSKTDVALLRDDGELLAIARGPQSSPHHLGVEGSLDVVEALLDNAVTSARLARSNGRVADVATLLLAGVDFPAEEVEVGERASARGWASRISVANDTFAVLRAGTERGWGVAVVCGAGINCVGVAPDGRHARFPALGAITGDWGGGYDVGLAALSAAARSEDGRGPRSSLQQSVPAHFELETPVQVAEAIHQGRLAQRRVVELAPLVLAEAETDEVAGGIVDRLAEEVVALARAALVKLGLEASPVEILLGGGLLRAGDGRLVGAIRQGLESVGPQIAVRAADSPPIVGAALLGLDELGATAEAQERIRRELVAAVDTEPEIDVLVENYVEVE